MISRKTPPFREQGAVRNSAFGLLLLAAKLGTMGTPCARLVAGPIACLLYLPLLRELRSESAVLPAMAPKAGWENA